MNPFDLSTEEIEKLVEKHGTPIYIVSKSKIIENYNRINNALPAVHIYYAIKANPHKEILKTLHKIGADFDVASKGEIMQTVSIGANPKDDLIFADPVKDPKHIEYAHSIGLDDFTYDNESEIIQLGRYAPDTNVHIRIKVSNEGSTAHLSKKFGAEPKDAVPLLLKAKEVGLIPKGVAFHVGSQCLDTDRYIEALNVTKEIFDEAKNKGLHLDTVDIGGGFPVKYINEDINIDKMCKTIVEHYETLFDKNIILTAEPGRSIVGDAVILVTKVISESKRDKQNWLYFDDGIYGSFLDTLAYDMEYPMKTNTNGSKNNYVLAGPTCDSIDVFSRKNIHEIREIELPEMHLDDLLIVGSMGAYTYSLATKFNGFEPPKFVYIN
ncbi:MAG: type III PLP-dependent enzyme [archaeon]